MYKSSPAPSSGPAAVPPAAVAAPAPVPKTASDRRDHKRRQKKRARARKLEGLHSTLLTASTTATSLAGSSATVSLLRVAASSGESSSSEAESAMSVAAAAKWSALGVLDPERGGRLGSRRAQRKRWQVESLARILRSIVQPGDRIVDFGAGSGNFGLPLAAMFPAATWTMVEMNAVACELMRSRARAAGLSNVTVFEGRIERYVEVLLKEGKGGVHAFDVGVAMHACGAATDYAQLACMESSAAFVLCPCCVGKLQLVGERPAAKPKLAAAAAPTAAAPPTLLQPRSRWLRTLLSGEDFRTLASVADHNALASAASVETTVGDGKRRVDVHRRCKVLLELDRSRCAEEAGYATFLSRLEPPEASRKRDVIVALPPVDGARGARWRVARESFRSRAAAAANMCWQCSDVGVEEALRLTAEIEEKPRSAGVSASSSASHSATAAAAVDVGGRPAVLDHVQVRLQCAFVIKRKERRCRNFVTECTTADGPSTFCFDHMPETLAKSRAASIKERTERETSAAARAAGVAGAGAGTVVVPGRISSSQKRMANPFAVQHQRAVPPIVANGDGAPFADSSRPLHIDIGCAKGRFVAALARHAAARLGGDTETSGTEWNYLGLEIRPALAAAAVEQHCFDECDGVESGGSRREEPSMRGRLHYVGCNVDVALSDAGLSAESTPHLLSAFPEGVLRMVTLQFPTPWRKVKHQRRRILQPRLVDALATLMPDGAQLYISSDIIDVAVDMCAVVELSSAFVPHPTAVRGAACEGREWLARCPFPVLSERERCCEETGVRVYRETFVRRRAM